MQELTHLGEAVCSADPKDLKLDRYIKNVLAFKPILARIFKEAIEECENMSYDEIESSIEGEIQIEVIGVNPGTSNTKITGSTQEDFVDGEGKITYDIRTFVRIPKTEDSVGVKLLIDVEAQKSDSPGYDIIERGIYYGARMISSQLSQEFTNKSADNVKYGNLKKVYSIWICTETAQNRANRIEKYFIGRKVIPPEKDSGYIPRYDLMQVVIINISKTHNIEDTKNELIRLLTDLFNETISGQKKVELLKDRYGLKTTAHFEKEVQNMTAYTARLINEGLEKGRTEGRQEGRREGENILVDTVMRLRNGESPEQIVASGVEQRTVDLALTIK